jgi:glutamine synthetase
VRIPGGRIEFRLPDAGCNPYLVTAAMLAAGLDGVDRKLDAGKPNNTNLYESSAKELADAGIGLLPQNLLEAIGALESDEVVCGALGPQLSKEFITLKRMEWTEYARHVSDWETQRYLEFF